MDLNNRMSWAVYYPLVLGKVNSVLCYMGRIQIINEYTNHMPKYCTSCVALNKTEKACQCCLHKLPCQLNLAYHDLQ